MAIGDRLSMSQLMLARFWRVLFLSMLVLLHLAALRGAEDLWARALMIAHFGLFIVWQPFMRGESRLTPPQTVGMLAVAAAMLFFLNWWLIALWVSLFAGIVGGKVFLFRARWLRRFYLLVLFYLVALLLVWVVPNTLLQTVPPGELQMLARYGLPVLFVVMALMPVEPDSAETPQIIDFFYSTLIFLLLVVLSLGALAFMRVGAIDYGPALTYSLLILAGVLLLLSLAWNPRGGFAGLSMYFSRYLLSIGLPFEQWLYFLAELSQMESRPERFLREACAGLRRLPWVTGGSWHAAGESGDFGAVSKHSVEYTNPAMRLKVFTGPSLSPSLAWHFQLLGQLLGEFYIAKLREQKLQQQTYVQAVHETGARMTHDVKNLLQSLNVLCVAAEGDEDPAKLAALIRRQLPSVTQRLQQTMDKLQRPEHESGQLVTAQSWWEAFQRGLQNRDVEFEAGDIDEAVLVPKELFDSAGDNFLQNALRKRKLDGGIKVRVGFRCRDTIELSVCDSGMAVAPEVLQGLLRGPVPSEAGYGIGLYQTARLAEILGFSIVLSANEPGNVCFTLKGDAKRPGAQP
jgi:signal transduction histidine kinase